jgi:hypothetical protein
MWYLISVIRGSTFILLLLPELEGRERPGRARSSVWGMGEVLNVLEIDGRRDLERVVEERVRERKVERRGDMMCLIEACVDAIVVIVGEAMEARDGEGDVEASDRLINFETGHVVVTVRQERLKRSDFKSAVPFGSPNSHPSPHELQGNLRRTIGRERCFLI